MVGAGVERSRSRAGVGYGGADDLLGCRLHVAKPRTACAGSIAAMGSEPGFVETRLDKQFLGARQEPNGHPLAVDD